MSLADAAATSGVARLRRHDFSIYFSGDQMVWEDAATIRSVGVFARIMGAPPDRNLVSFSLNTGVSLKAPFLSRPNDTFGVGYGLAEVSAAASELDQDTAVYTADPAYPVRSSESFVEVTYQAQIAPLVAGAAGTRSTSSRPRAASRDPLNAGGASTPRIGNEAILGVRTNITF